MTNNKVARNWRSKYSFYIMAFQMERMSYSPNIYKVHIFSGKESVRLQPTNSNACTNTLFYQINKEA